MRSTRFADRVALVTGAGAGFGKATAVGFAREGARCIGLVERYADRLDAVCSEIEAHGARPVPLAADLQDAASAAAVVDGYGPKLPRGRRWLAFLNKASDDRLKAAEKLGETLLRRGAPEVVFGEAIRPHECFYRMTAGSGSEASSE